jgi:long-chain acyl-CoA synthetase
MISGGEYLPPDLYFNIVKGLKIPLVQGYGLTECMPIICNVPGGPDKPESLGIPGRKDILVKIVNPEMKNLETGKVGEIIIKSPTTMKRYHNRPEDTKNTFYNGWLKTGDLGRIDHEGFLFFFGLKKKIYNLSGLKVDPFELELVGKLNPKVKDIKISAETIEGILPRKALVADVLINDNATLEEKELREFYKSNIALYKVPKYIKLRKQNSSMVMSKTLF